MTKQRHGRIVNIVSIVGVMGMWADIAAAVRFLVSDEAAYVTGHVLHVNGGMLMP